MIKKATERDIWFYKGLKIEYVPLTSKLKITTIGYKIYN